MKLQFSIVPCVVLAALLFTGCASTSNLLNPFYEAPKPEALLGDRNDHALSEEKGKAEKARNALEAMATYKRAHDAEPNNPVMQPAVVRVMWIPDHLNSHGDLVPDHYYYVKVLSERWAVSDAFELNSQLNGRGGFSGGGGALPFTTKDDIDASR